MILLGFSNLVPIITPSSRKGCANDVSLDKAYQKGYYLQMVELIRSLFSQVLKTNQNLYFAVITGCLRIAKESILQDLIIRNKE